MRLCCSVDNDIIHTIIEQLSGRCEESQSSSDDLQPYNECPGDNHQHFEHPDINKQHCEHPNDDQYSDYDQHFECPGDDQYFECPDDGQYFEHPDDDQYFERPEMKSTMKRSTLRMIDHQLMMIQIMIHCSQMILLFMQVLPSLSM